MTELRMQLVSCSTRKVSHITKSTCYAGCYTINSVLDAQRRSTIRDSWFTLLRLQCLYSVNSYYLISIPPREPWFGCLAYLTSQVASTLTSITSYHYSVDHTSASSHVSTICHVLIIYMLTRYLTPPSRLYSSNTRKEYLSASSTISETVR
jgi:hypothetical protein